MKPQTNLQDVFLNQARKESITCVVYLVNGFQIRGLIRGFDNFTVALESDNRQMLIYKHAISTITPLRSIDFISSGVTTE